MSPTSALVENPFPPGSRIDMRLANGEFLSLQVIEPFLPFTKSQVFLVRPEPASRELPHELVLKIYDPRYIDDRLKPKVPTPNLLRHSWTLEAEIEAGRYRREVAEGKRPDELSAECSLRPPMQRAEPYLWEEHYYRVMEDSWKSEKYAFNQLISLQGTVIPKFYGSGNVIPLPNTRAIQPFAILMEYIHGTTLATIDPVKVNVPPAIFYPMLDAVKTFGDLGMCHADMRPENLLVAPSDAPTRAVLIDFGCTVLRNDASDELWKENVEAFRDERWLRRALDKKGIIRLDG